MEARVLTQQQDLDPVFPLVRALARLHDLVALVDRSGELLWLSDGLVELCGSRLHGAQWLEALAKPRSEGLASRLSAIGQLSGEAIDLRGRHGPLPARVSAAQLEQGGLPPFSVVAIEVEIQHGSMSRLRM